jgi:signal transduction histidine kinase
MKRLQRLNLARLESILPLFIFVILVGFTYALFFQVPYAGIDFSPQGTIFSVYVVNSPSNNLHVGDQLIQVGPVSWADFRKDLRQPLFNQVRPGQVVPLVVLRNGQQLTIPWTFPGPTREETWERLYSEWPLAYIFWLVGTFTLLFLRPKDELWHLLIAFNFLTALWLSVGGALSLWHVWEGAIILRGAIWLSVPVYLHLHWRLPSPVGRLPSIFWWILYLASAGLAALEWFQFLPTNLYFLGLLLALAGSVLLLIAHFILQPLHRPDIRQLIIIWIPLSPLILVSLIGALTFLPLGKISLIVDILNESVSNVSRFGRWFLIVLPLPILPSAHLYMAYHREFGTQELRANRFIALYLFVLLLVAIMAILIPTTETIFPDNAVLIEFAALIVLTVITALGFPSFQRFVERHVLGAPLPPTHLLETYAARITTSLNTPRLVHLLIDEVLPSLLVRQSALLRYDEDHLAVVYVQAVEPVHLPSHPDLPVLLTQAGKYRAMERNYLLYPWVRLILPLSIGSNVIGLWLLGRRDPDDFYSQVEISILQALAHQTAIALTNITYAERLHALYQTSIDQREAERASLGRDLHDHLLQNLGILRESAMAFRDSPPFVKAYKAVLFDLRQIIRGLRPPMLEYGLYRALAALTDDWVKRSDAPSGPRISLDVPENDVRYAPHAELHLYRIIQQAGENALRHARARNIRIHGCLKPDLVDLTAEDDGVGFEVQELLDLARPEARSHFGLIGMQERASLIKAQIKFDSALGRGTRVHLKWSPET